MVKRYALMIAAAARVSSRALAAVSLAAVTAAATAVPPAVRSRIFLRCRCRLTVWSWRLSAVVLPARSLLPGGFRHRLQW